ncbi:MAG: hypothetical protein QNL62_10725 [Gammaproteobacteria bacterium]|nr:hypothetical protein [Gammaproteobacteria bacterium]
MKPTFGIIIILSILTLAGCATPTSEYNKAREINSIESYKAYVEEFPYGRYTNKAKEKIAELTKTETKKYQLKNNWEKLIKGMSVDDVDSLIGPLNRTAVRNIKKLADNKNGQKAEGGFPYGGRFFTLKFDENGRLSEWSLK